MDITAHVNHNGVELQIDLDVTVSGRFIPETRIDPAEYPDYEWSFDQVTYNNRTVKNIKQSNMDALDALVSIQIDGLLP